MANKAIEILKKAEHDLGIEIKMWQNQNRPEIASRCKIEKVQVKQAIEKLCWGEESNAQSNCNIHSFSVALLAFCKWLREQDFTDDGTSCETWVNDFLASYER